MKANSTVLASYEARNLSGANLSGAKELTDRYLLAWYDPETQRITALVDARCWMGRSRASSVVYASVRIGEHHRWSGRGKAGGCGYHKASAAIGEAIRSAGWELDEDIQGAGSRAVEEALLAIGRALKGPDAVLEVLS